MASRFANVIFHPGTPLESSMWELCIQPPVYTVPGQTLACLPCPMTAPWELAVVGGGGPMHGNGGFPSLLSSVREEPPFTGEGSQYLQDKTLKRNLLQVDGGVERIPHLHLYLVRVMDRVLARFKVPPHMPAPINTTIGPNRWGLSGEGLCW